MKSRLVEQFEALEKKIDQVLACIDRLQKENQQLKRQVMELENLRTAVVEQLNSIIDKIDSRL
ncbi:MAG: hypothetical protein ACP5JB_06965 [candidate division WOR-3 bacterium]|jgi:CHASE3 domain sensor protein